MKPESTARSWIVPHGPGILTRHRRARGGAEAVESRSPARLRGFLPVVVTLTFATLVLAPRPGFAPIGAAVLAFASPTTLVVLNSCRLLASESFGFSVASILHARVARGGRAMRTRGLIRAGAALVSLSRVLSMARNGSFLLAPGALLAYATLKVDGTWRSRAGFLVVVLILSAAPSWHGTSRVRASTMRVTIPSAGFSSS